MSKTRSQLISIVGSEDRFDEQFFESLEEALIAADIGMELSEEIIDDLNWRIDEEGIRDIREAYKELKRVLASSLNVVKLPEEFPPRPWVILVVGVNGVGKTTTIGKMA
ncbi:MAG TPA: signal recognition particle receptor subunit alpha, partial [Chitinispirillaceae bacterium]|nr:signal recognition particle receptor subunit alpha [Chitinispirillaceae bacterium]